MEKGTVTVNFEYEGCDPNPSALINTNNKRVQPKTANPYKIRPKFSCVNGQSYERVLDNGQIDKPYFQETGQVQFEYDYAGDKNCKEKDMKKRKIRGVYPVDFFYKQLEATRNASGKACQPIALTFVDSPRTPEGGEAPGNAVLHRYTNQGKLCDIPAKKITLPGFSTDDSPMTELSVKDDEFSFGDNTFYKFIPDKDGSGKGKWAARFVKKDKNGKVIDKQKPAANFDFSTPIPVMYRREGKVHLAATVLLNEDGTASIKSQGPGKSYPNAAAIRADRKNYHKNDDDTKGEIKIDMKSFGGKVSQTKVSAYDAEGKHIRTMNTVARNVLGYNYKDSWCGEENCFRRGVQEENLCKNKGTNDIKMNYGGSDNVCYSCLGVTAGTCDPASEDSLNNFRDKTAAALKEAKKNDQNRAAQTKKKDEALPKDVDVFERLFQNSIRTAKGKVNKCRVGYAQDPNTKTDKKMNKKNSNKTKQ